MRLYQRASASPIVCVATQPALRACDPTRPPSASGAAASVRGNAATFTGGMAATQAVDPVASVLRNLRTMCDAQCWKS